MIALTNYEKPKQHFLFAVFWPYRHRFGPISKISKVLLDGSPGEFGARLFQSCRASLSESLRFIKSCFLKMCISQIMILKVRILKIMIRETARFQNHGPWARGRVPELKNVSCPRITKKMFPELQ